MISRHHGHPIEGPLKLHEHHMQHYGIEEDLKLNIKKIDRTSRIILCRETSLSRTPSEIFYQSGSALLHINWIEYFIGCWSVIASVNIG